jgi:hypothetical protein
LATPPELPSCQKGDVRCSSYGCMMLSLLWSMPYGDMSLPGYRDYTIYWDACSSRYPRHSESERCQAVFENWIGPLLGCNNGRAGFAPRGGRRYVGICQPWKRHRDLSHLRRGQPAGVEFREVQHPMVTAASWPGIGLARLARTFGCSHCSTGRRCGGDCRDVRRRYGMGLAISARQDPCVGNGPT